jgi:stage II sporulation protein P
MRCIHYASTVKHCNARVCATVKGDRKLFQRAFIVVVIFMGIFSVMYVKLDVSPVVAKVVMNTKSTQFQWILEQEMPLTVLTTVEDRPDSLQWGQLLFSLVTKVNFDDPRTLIGGEIPSFQSFQYYVLNEDDEPVNYTDHPIESPEPEVIWDHIVEPLPEEEVTGNPNSSIQPSASAPKVFIYNTHYWESFLSLPEFANITDPDKATHKTKNITLVGKKLGAELQQRGIQSIVQKEYEPIQYNKAYDASLELVQTVMTEENKNFDYIIDIHRDSRRKKDTTVEIDGQSYARIWIVIGKGNNNWRENYEEALKIKKVMDRMYPSLFKEVLVKNSGHGEYNQSVSSRTLLFEIGGVDNTLEEEYRSTSALADVLQEILMDARSVKAN